MQTRAAICLERMGEHLPTIVAIKRYVLRAPHRQAVHAPQTDIREGDRQAALSPQAVRWLSRRCRRHELWISLKVRNHRVAAAYQGRN